VTFFRRLGGTGHHLVSLTVDHLVCKVDEAAPIIDGRSDRSAAALKYGYSGHLPQCSSSVVASKTAYVGNRRDNDILPALNAGLTTVFIRRGRWSYCYATRPEAERRMCASTASWHCLSGCAAAVATAERASLAEKSMVD
jgi:hypothetical protein